MDTCLEGVNSTWIFYLIVLSNYVRWITKIQAAISDGTTMIDETIAIVANRFSTRAETSIVRESPPFCYTQHTDVFENRIGPTESQLSLAELLVESLLLSGRFFQW